MLTRSQRLPISLRAVVPFLFLTGCERQAETLFIRLEPDDSGITFQNTIQETPEMNILTYEYAYNGGGVAAGDFNNDGLCDLYFTGNTVSNKLYLNNGEMTFKDVTENAGVQGRSLWKTGVTTVDINADGWLDLYVCYSGPDAKQSLSNELFINNGLDNNRQLTFTERAKEYGLDAPGTYSTQAAFFDYDGDGDLDMFLLNHGNHFYSPFINTNQLRNMRHPEFGNRLYRNNGTSRADPQFEEVSSEAGIHGGGINFGLGVSISDVNDDGWSDIYVTNDYEEQDFLYLNNQNGTFKEITKHAFGHLSRNGMGTDIADFNNDGRPDLIEVDMWPEDNFRQKLLKGPDDHNRYTLMVDSGFHHQQMRNTLQMNAGNTPDGTPVFCEIGQLAGVSATDWSWAPLFADLDNDGFKDLFVTNGYLRDFTSMDFLKYTVEEARAKAREQGTDLSLSGLVGKMSSTKTTDYVFRNNGDLTFFNATKAWGLDVPNLSFGATYADLDNDGDLELITNNTNETATIWINQSNATGSENYLRIRLKGPASNPLGVGSKVFVENRSSIQLQEQFCTRGFQSAVEPILHFGLGKSDEVSRIKVIWPDQKESILTGVKPNQVLDVDYATARNLTKEDQSIDSLFSDITTSSGLDFIHRENPFIDFDREPLIPYQLSRLGPALAKADVNGDGSDDFFVGGALGQSGRLYLADGAGHFTAAARQPWDEDSSKEDVGATFFDVDGDNDADLFVASGGNEYLAGSELLDDRLYINDGKGLFTKAPESSVIADHASGSCVASADYDRDGDMDLYVGGRIDPGNFPHPTAGAVLRNESSKDKGIRFSVATREVNADLRQPGMVTDALWTDFNGDSWPDLLIVGEWMSPKIFRNEGGKLYEVKSEVLDNSSGLWNRIASLDFDKDGDMDYVLGNAGSNLPWKVSADQPLIIYYSDFNNDNRVDPVICYTSEGKEYPIASRDEMLRQVNTLRKKFTSYAAYAKATIGDIFDRQSLEKASKLKVQTLQTSVLENLGEGKLKLSPLPVSAQVSRVNGIVSQDFNRDGFTDILLAGNFYPYRTEFGRSDAGIGLLLLGDGKGNWQPLPSDRSGFYAAGDIRNMAFLNGKAGHQFILLARNNDKMSLIDFDNFD